MTKRASQKQFHYVYKTTCKITGRWYIGLHSTDDLSDGYVGSGMLLWKSIKKHGLGNHHTEILELFPSRSDASDAEKALVEQAKLDPMCMNLASGGIGFTDRPKTSESTRLKLSAAALGKRKSAAHCESIRRARIGVPSSSKSKNGKKWNITFPDGSVHKVESLKRWAHENGISNYRRLRASRPVNGFLAIPVDR